MEKFQIKDHFSNLQKSLDSITEESYKNFFIIHSFDYLINYLGCLILSLMNKDSLKQLQKAKKLFSLTAGEWVEVIEYAFKISNFSNHLRKLLIEKFLTAEENPQLHDYYKRWLKLRNTLAHSIVIPKSEILKKYSFISIEDIFKKLITDLEDISKRYAKKISKSQFFNYIDGAIYIYARIINGDKIEYRHFSKPSIEKSRPTDFPIVFKEIFLSLEETPDDFLFGIDKIKVSIKTAFSKPYENEFQIYIDDKTVKALNKRYSNGDMIEFDPSEVSDIPEGDVSVEVKALRFGNVQSNIKKRIRIFKQQPVPEINWSNGNTHITVPIGIKQNIDCIIKSKFPITITRLTAETQNKKSSLSVTNEENNFKTEIPIYSSKPGTEYISIVIDYKNAFSESCTYKSSLSMAFEPNFFEPEFTGEERLSFLRQMINERQNYMILGEGGIGKSRLIKEYIKNQKFIKSYEITIGGKAVIDKLAEIFNITDENKEFDILNSLSKITAKTLLWFQDCHEYIDKREIEFLKRIIKLAEENRNLHIILEARDETWSPKARNFINELAQENVIIHRLNRLNEKELIKIMDSVFDRNAFPEDKKRFIANKSDGIVYIMLDILRILYRKNCVEYIENNPIYKWRFTNTENFDRILTELNVNKIMSIGLSETLNELGEKGFKEKAIELMRYLCIDAISAKDLSKLLELSLINTTEILRNLKSHYLIKEIRKEGTDILFYTFHHQIKRDIFAKSYFSEELFCHYHFMVEIVTSSEDSPTRQINIKEFLRRFIDKDDESSQVESIENDETNLTLKNKAEECINNLQIEPPFVYEKMKYLFVYHVYLCVDNVERILHIIQENREYLSNKEFFILIYNLYERYSGVKLNYLYPPLFSGDIDMNLIEELRKPLILMKNLISNEELEDIDLYYLIESSIEEVLFILYLYEGAIKNGFSGFDEEGYISETECHYWYGQQTFFHLTKYLPLNSNFLADLSKQIEQLWEYRKLIKSSNINIEDYSFEFVHFPSPCDNCKVDFLPVLFHIEALLMLIGLQDSDKYLQYMNEFFNTCKINKAKKDIILAHLLSIKETGLNVKSLVEILPLHIKEMLNGS